MKYALISMAFVCLVFSCHTPEPPPKQISTCNCEILKTSERDIQKWFNVSKFDSKNPDCYKLLRQFASATSKHENQVTYHFFDNLPNFTPPENGDNYGGQKIMDQEILLFNKIGGQEFFIFDNWETGKYIEVK